MSRYGYKILLFRRVPGVSEAKLYIAPQYNGVKNRNLSIYRVGVREGKRTGSRARGA